MSSTEPLDLLVREIRTYAKLDDADVRAVLDLPHLSLIHI